VHTAPEFQGQYGTLRTITSRVMRDQPHADAVRTTDVALSRPYGSRQPFSLA
jgi:hypothetical protein